MAPTVQNQHVFVMRHGELADNVVDKSWRTTVPKPWKAPLTDAAVTEAIKTGWNLQTEELGFRIHRVVVSPWRGCVQTARWLVWGIADATAYSSTLRIKVSIEYGMCEIMNDVALWCHPTDHTSWGIDLEELEATFSPDLVDVARDRVLSELPQWGESESGAKDRYLLTIHSLVDKYPEENLLFVTHGEGVKVTASTYWKEATGYNITPKFLGYAHLKRQIVRNDDLFTANRFMIATNPDETSITRELLRHA